MKQIISKRQKILYFFILISSVVYCQNSQELVDFGNQAFEKGEKEKAKQFFLQAAKMDNAEAHYALAYRFILPNEESIFHYSEAAKGGKQEALESIFEILFLRANSLVNANPGLVFDIYEKAKTNNPSMHIFGEEEYVSILEKCMEAEPFNGTEFMKKYGIKEFELKGFYSIWELAEEASRGGRFGKPNPKLVFQLVCRGGSVPVELELAINETYKNWQENKIVPFKICDFVTSGIGISYCTQIQEVEVNKKYDKRIKKLETVLKNKAGILLKDAYNIASNFFEAKAELEEGHDGTGYIAWMKESVIKQKLDYLNLIQQINDGVDQDSLVSEVNWDIELNETYKNVMSELKKNPITGGHFSISDSNILQVQRLWIKYRDSSAKLFSRINPSIKEDIWLNWLTKIRTAELNHILELRY